MLVSLKRRRAVLAAFAFALGFAAACAKKPPPSDRGSASGAARLPDLPEPAGVLGELSIAHPDATFRTLRELGRPLSALLPGGFALFATNLLGLPPLSADSFDLDLPVLGLLVQDAQSEPGWVLALHAVSGPELVAKLCTGDQAPFHTSTSGVAGLELIEPSESKSTPPANKARFSLAVFDNYLLVGASRELLGSAGPYAARMLPRRPAAEAPIALRFTQHALKHKVVPALRGLWAAYRVRLSHLDEQSRSAHGGHAPDFADPATVILGADALVESVLALLDGGAALELGVTPWPSRMDASLVLEPESGSEVQAKLLTLAAGNARALLALPAETQFALGLARTAEERETDAKAAGDDWVRLLGSRLSDRDAGVLRAVLADWELGRGGQTSYGFLGGTAPGAFLVTEVADPVRLKRAGSGFFGLLALPGLRAPVVEFLGQPRVSAGSVGADAMPQASRKVLTFTPAAGRKTAASSLAFAWLVEERTGFAAAGKEADTALKALVASARGDHATLGAQAGIAESVQRIGDQAALYAYLDARVLAHAEDAASELPEPVLLSLGKREKNAFVRLEISKLAVDWALQGAVGK